MLFVSFWIIMAVVVAIVAGSKGRNMLGWGFYGFLIWPIALVHILCVRPERHVTEARDLAAGDVRKCPACAELVKREAKICRFCHTDLAAPEAAAS